MERTCFVFPNRRSIAFFRKYLAAEVAASGKPCVAPKMLTINDFFYRAAGAVPTDRLQLLLELYSCYRELNEKAEPLDDFIFWGGVVLSDFNDVDKYLCDADRLFANVADFRALLASPDYLSETQVAAVTRFVDHFNSGGRYKESFLRLWEILKPLYRNFNARLRQKGMSYEGQVYRNLADRLDTESAADVFAGAFPGTEKFVFVALNALNGCEKKVLRRLRDAGLAAFCWDYSSEMIKDPHNKSSLFLSQNVLEFPQAFDPDPEGLGLPEVNVLSVPSSVGQAKQLPGILSRLAPEGLGELGEESAVVLPDEGLLIPVLNSIPEEIKDINVTMGYPLGGSELWSLMNAVAALQMHLRLKDGVWYFYNRQVRAVFANSIFKTVTDEAEKEAVAGILESGEFYVPESSFAGKGLLSVIFTPVLKSPSEADAVQCSALASYLRSVVTAVAGRLTPEEGSNMAVEKDFAKEYYQLLTRLGSYSLELKPSSWMRLLGQLLSGMAVPFLGEPLKGLQIMGPLETRALDFKNLVVLGCNEGLFPRRSVASSFIPAELRKGFELPTYEYQDAVWAYYFYRMIQRAEKVWLLYDSRTEISRSGEESRYIKQLEMHFGIPVRRFVQSSLIRTAPAEGDIPKTEEDLAVLKGKYLSASSLQDYLSCPARFYYHSVKGLRDKEELSENLDAGMIGNVFHETMQEIYGVSGGRITAEYVSAIMKDKGRIREIVRRKILGQLRTFEVVGRNLLFEDMVCRYAAKVLQRDLDYMKACGTDGFDVLGLEQRVFDEIGGFRFKGYIDRLDSFVPGEVRVVDYKTGKVTDEDFLIDDGNAADVVEKVFGPDDSKRPKIALQLYLYDTFVRHDRQTAPLVKGRSLVNSVYQTSRLFVREVENVALSPVFTSLMEERLGELLAEIADPAVPFRRCPDAKNCEWCDFKMLCGR